MLAPAVTNKMPWSKQVLNCLLSAEWNGTFSKSASTNESLLVACAPLLLRPKLTALPTFDEFTERNDKEKSDKNRL
jgi:hypothetical protein